MVYIMHIKVRGARVFNEGYRNGVETKPGAVFRLPTTFSTRKLEIGAIGGN